MKPKPPGWVSPDHNTQEGYDSLAGSLRRGRPPDREFLRTTSAEGWRQRALVETAQQEKDRTAKAAEAADRVFRKAVQDSLIKGFIAETLAVWTGLSVSRIRQIGNGRRT